jgi:pimeloyl-ACP methyl ester carboxylesterase
MPFADNDGARLHWDERGEGSPLLLVMGHSYTSAMWYPVLDELSKDHRLIWFDNRGTGQSSPMRKITVADMARDAFAVMDAAGVESAHLYGVSMGGGIVLEMARQHPERVRSLLLGCTLAKTPGLARLPLLLRPLVHLPAPLLYKILTSQRRDNPHPYGTAAPADRVAKDQAVLAANPGNVHASVAQSRAINKYSITEAEVRALTMPALVLHGTEDAAVPYASGVTLHELIAHSEMVTLEGAGHNYFIAAGDRANAAARDFLRRVDEAIVGAV